MFKLLTKLFREQKHIAYCFRCKGKKLIQTPRYISMPRKVSGGRRVTGICVTCGGKVSSFTSWD